MIFSENRYHFSGSCSGAKKAGLEEPGLRHWPREADTITFQEGLLSVRATGGGGQMRNANAQRGNTMSLGRVLQQAPEPHVSHAEIGYPHVASMWASAAPC